jgi:hypothetical protein
MTAQTATRAGDVTVGVVVALSIHIAVLAVITRARGLDREIESVPEAEVETMTVTPVGDDRAAAAGHTEPVAAPAQVAPAAPSAPASEAKEPPAPTTEPPLPTLPEAPTTSASTVATTATSASATLTPAASASAIATTAPTATSAAPTEATSASATTATSAAPGGDGSDTDPMRARQLGLYRTQLDAWFSARFPIRGKVAWETLRTLRAVVDVRVSDDRRIDAATIVTPSGDAVFDATLRATLDASVGATLPAPPERYGDLLGRTLRLVFRCTNRSQCE